MPWRKRLPPHPFLLLAILSPAILSNPLRAQQDSCLNRTIAVNVLTEDVQFIDGLATQNFRGKVHGQPVKIVSATHDHAPRRIVLVLDSSGSMGDKWGLEIYAAKSLLDADPASSFALITFGEKIKDRIDFAEGREKVSDELARLESPVENGPRGGTALRDALAAAVDLLRPVQLGDAIYVVSDGGDNASKVSWPQVSDDLLSAGVRLFALVTVEEMARSRSMSERNGPESLHGLVTATGGDFKILTLDFHWYSLPGSKAPPKLPVEHRRILTFATIGFDIEITEYYRLAIKLPEPLDKPRDLDLDVLDANVKKNSHWLVVYPHRLAACP